MILPLRLLVLASFQLRVFVSIVGHLCIHFWCFAAASEGKKQGTVISNTSGGFAPWRQLHLNASDLQTQSNAFERSPVCLLTRAPLASWHDRSHGKIHQSTVVFITLDGSQQNWRNCEFVLVKYWAIKTQQAVNNKNNQITPQCHGVLKQYSGGGGLRRYFCDVAKLLRLIPQWIKTELALIGCVTFTQLLTSMLTLEVFVSRQRCNEKSQVSANGCNTVH